MVILTNRQARQFMLLKHGLLGEHRFSDKQGALDYIRQAGCIQFDPVDVCGKNAELTLQSRVKHFTKQMLNDLLYKDRKLFDYPDKNLSILPIEDWAYFERDREAARKSRQRFEGLAELETQAKAYITANGAVNSADLPLQGSLRWQSAIHWSGGQDGNTKAARAVLEQMYATGELLVHHKKGSRKYYDLAERYLSGDVRNAPDPLPDEFEHQKWRVFRRIGAVGLLADRPSDAWLNIGGLKNEIRGAAFGALVEEGKICAVSVEGLPYLLYLQTADIPLTDIVIQNATFKPRCELLAPLDPFLWDRKLIRALFGFEYSWEIYTPPQKRKYGVYVLPILYGDRFVGRVEAVCERKAQTLVVKHIWYEEDVRRTRKLEAAIDGCLKRFAKFNGCERIEKTVIT